MQSKSNVKVTIIVPVHNSEKYLWQCLESALSQTLQDIEVLCIDSSNTDRCFQIITKMQEQDNRIAYIKDSNSSYGYKINAGIELAKGDYISILETDDQMSSDMLEKLYSVVQLYHVDMVCSDYFQFFEYKGRKIGEKCKLYSSFQAYDQLMNYAVKMSETTVANGDHKCFPSNFATGGKNYAGFHAVSANLLWTALYQKSFLLAHNIRLNESPGASYQDTSFLFLTGLLAKSVYYLDEAFYWYRMDNVSSSVKDDKKIFEIADEYKFLKQELEKRNIKDVGVWNLFYYRKYSGFYWNYRRLSEKARELFLKRYLEELRNDIAIGAFNRKICDIIFYQHTFLLLDDPDKFKEIVNEESQHRSIMTMPETLDKLEGREVVIFGAGIWGTKVIDVLQQNENRILRICDNAEKLHGTTLAGVEIGPVAETVERFPNAYYLIVSRRYSEEMKAQLLAEGISEKNIEIFK